MYIIFWKSRGGVKDWGFFSNIVDAVEAKDNLIKGGCEVGIVEVIKFPVETAESPYDIALGKCPEEQAFDKAAGID